MINFLTGITKDFKLFYHNFDFYKIQDDKNKSSKFEVIYLQNVGRDGFLFFYHNFEKVIKTSH